MINLNRPATAPASLQDTRVQEYLDKLADYKDNPSLPKPEPPINYRSSDVLEFFDAYFHAKCYLTEQKFANSWLMDIDHFVPKHERPELRYEWTNLFPVEHNANMMRPRKTPAGGYLDPCAEADDIEKEICCRIPFGGGKPRFYAVYEGNAKAKNTAHLLNLLHQGRENDLDSRKKAEALRHIIRKRCELVLKKILEWQNAQLKGDQHEIFRKQQHLKVLLSRKSSFTMVVRSLDAVKQFVPREFLD